MATRTYCDHCGNTISAPNVMSYGPMKEQYNHLAMPQGLHQHALGHAQAGGIGMLVGSQSPPYSPSTPAKQLQPIIDVDLCDTCVPIWLDRVKQLTARSNPGEA